MPASMRQLGTMFNTLAEVSRHLSLSLETLLVNAMVDFRDKYIKFAKDKGKLLEKAQDDYEAALVKALNRKKVVPLAPQAVAALSVKQKKEHQAALDQLEADKQALSAMRRTFESLRFEQMQVLNDIQTARR